MLYTLGEAALRTAVLAGILQLTLSVLRVRRSRLLLAAWTIVLAISLAMPVLLRSSPLLIPLDESVPQALIAGAADLMQQPSMATPAVISGIETHVQPSVEAWLGLAYAAIAGGLGLRVLLGVALSLRILARAAPAGPDWAAGSRVRLSRDVAGPVTIARTIVLPADCVEWPVDTRQAVLAHERAHVSQLDYAMLVVAQLNRALFWFSPLSWWLYHRLAVLTELVSDDRAIEVTRDRIGYAEILLEMAQRPGPVARGPLMARFSTLPRRIDRILLDEMTSYRVSRLQWVTLALGVAAAALTIANVAPSVVLKPIAIGPSDLGIQDVEPPPRAAPPSNERPPEKTLEPTASNAPLPRNIAPPIARTQPARLPAPTRPAVQTPAKNTIPLPPTVPEQATRLATSSAGRPAVPAPVLADQRKTDPEDRQAIVTPKESSVLQRSEILYPRETVSDPLQANVDRLNGSTCVGTIAVGAKAYYSGGQLLEPGVTAGQIVPAKAQFFRKPDGSPWVRFASFERPPLDVKVQPTRSGVTWTGEYGISYAVQDAGNGRFIGLAAKIANDSATLNFACKK